MTQKYDFRLNPMYNIDVRNLPTGKLLAATKRKVQFKFGFSNKDAIAQGLVGVEARGEEHEVTLAWSLVSGKRYVHADGEEVHYSRGNRTDSSFETSWTMNGGYTIKVIAHAFVPLNHVPGFRQFDLRLDGCSIYDMPKIYELGTDRSTRLVSSSLGGSHAFALPPLSLMSDGHDYGHETADMKAEKLLKPESAPSPPEPMVDLLDCTVDLMDQNPIQPEPFVGDSLGPVCISPEGTSFELATNSIMVPTPVQPTVTAFALANESHTYGVPMPHLATYGPQFPCGETTTQSSQQVYTQQTQTYHQYSMSYATPSATYNAQTHGGYDMPQSMVVSPDDSPVNAPQTPFVSTMLSMASLSLYELEDTASLGHKSELELALDSLVNLEDITETKEAPEHIKAALNKQRIAASRSTPCPARTGYLGSQATLGDIQARVGPKASPSKEIMRTHAFHPAAPHTGMMILYGHGPQSISATTGFGVGAAMQSYRQHQATYFGQSHQQTYAS